MIWRRKEADEEAAVQAIRNRFAAVLGLEYQGRDTNASVPTGFSVADETELTAGSMSKTNGEPHRTAVAIATSADLQAIEENIRQKSEVCLREDLRLPEPSIEYPLGPTNFHRMTASPETCPLSSEVLLSIVDAEASHFVQKTKELIERQSKLFEDTLARMLSQAFSQAEVSLQKAASRLEIYYCQVTESEQVTDRSGTDPSPGRY